MIIIIQLTKTLLRQIKYKKCVGVLYCTTFPDSLQTARNKGNHPDRPLFPHSWAPVTIEAVTTVA